MVKNNKLTYHLDVFQKSFGLSDEVMENEYTNESIPVPTTSNTKLFNIINVAKPGYGTRRLSMNVEPVGARKKSCSWTSKDRGDEIATETYKPFR
jgi:hypothetical protein